MLLKLSLINFGYPLKVKRGKAGNRSQFIQRHLPVNCLLDMPYNLVDAFKMFLGLLHWVCFVFRVAVVTFSNSCIDCIPVKTFKVLVVVIRCWRINSYMPISKKLLQVMLCDFIEWADNVHNFFLWELFYTVKSCCNIVWVVMMSDSISCKTLMEFGR